VAIYYGKNGELRLYDGTGTPNYVVVLFSNMDINVPEGSGRPEEIPRMNRGQLDDNLSYIQGLDDPILEPTTLTMSFMLDSGVKDLIHEFIGIRFAAGQQATWEAGSVPTALTTTKGTSTGRKAGLSGNLVTLPTFTDPVKVCVDVEVLWSIFGGGQADGRKITEVYFPPGDQSVVEAADSVTINLSGQVYGNVTAITSFTTPGTELTAS